MKPRPLGVTILSVLMFLNVTTYLTLLILSIVNRETLRSLLMTLSPGGSGPANFHLRMGALLPLYYGTMTVVTVVMALGLWKLRNWTRIVALVLIGISLIAAIPDGVHVIASGSLGAAAAFLVRVALSVLIGWYLLSNRVREALCKITVDNI